MNKRQKKKLKKRHTSNIITEIKDATSIEDETNKLLRRAAEEVEKFIDKSKLSSYKDLPTVFRSDTGLPYILSEPIKIRIFDIIFQEDNKNE